MLAHCCAAGVVLLSGSAFLGWLFQNARLKSILLPWPNQAPLSAPTFLLTAVSLWCLSTVEPTAHGPPGSPRNRSLSQLCALVVALVGVYRLGAYLTGWHADLEMLGFVDVLPTGKAPTHMAQVTALEFILIGGAMFFATAARHPIWSHLPAVACGLGGCLGLMRYVYGGVPLALYTDMSAISAVCFSLLSLGVLCARPDLGLTALLLSDTVGGGMTRRLLPAAIAMPFLFSWLLLKAEQAEYFGLESALGLFAMSNVVLFTALIWATARMVHSDELKRRLALQRLHDADELWREQLRASLAERKRAEDELRVSEKKLSSVLENMSDGVMLVDASGDAFYQNPASLRIHGLDPSEPGRPRNQDMPVHWTGWDEQGRRLGFEEWPISRVTRGERVYDQVLRARREETDHEFFASYNGATIYDDHGNVSLSFLTIQDITARKRAELAMQESEERFRTMANSIFQLAWIAKADGFIFWYNQRWYDYVGALPGQMEDWDWQSVHDPKIFPQVMKEWAAAIAAGQTFEMEFPLRGADGRFRRFLTRAVPIKDAAGQVVQWFGTNTDVEALKQAEQAIRESAEYFRFLNALVESTRSLEEPAQMVAVMARMLGVHLHASRCAYADVDADGEQFNILQDYTDGCASTVGRYQLSLFGPRAVATLHRGQALIIRNVAAELLPEEGAEMFQAIGIQAIITCPLIKAGALSAMMAVHQSTPRDWQASEIALVQHVVERCWAAIERRNGEDSIRRLNASLEQRVVERTAELEVANKELESFCYSVSHDLRAPLRGIHSFVRMIQEDCAEQLDAEGDRMLNVVSSEAKRMGQLIDDLLAFSRLGRQQMDKGVVDMGALARAAFESIVATSSPPGATPCFDLGQLPPARGDVALLRQVFVNLIGNAIKYSGKQAAPSIEVGGFRGDGESTYYVKDNGVGFDEKFSHKLFGVFQRLHSEAEFEGTGVGLAIVQRVVHRHGGKVRAQSKPGEGAVFYFTLPSSELSS